MTDFHPSTPPVGSGRSTAEYRTFAPVDPLNMRSLLFLNVAEQMLLDETWTHRAVTVTLESHSGPGRFAFYGANHVDAITAVHRGDLDFSILNPSALLTMAHRGVGAFDTPHDVATIAVMPHDDALGFAVVDRLGFTSLEQIGEARYPLRVSTRGSLDVCTSIMIDVVLRAHGFSLDDLRSWGGEVFNDQPMPMHPSRMGRLADGAIDAIFDEAVGGWADMLADAGAQLLPLSPEKTTQLTTQGFRPATLEADQHPTLHADVATVDFGGWPIYCRADASDDLVDQFCRALAERRDHIAWQIGPVTQPPLPLDRMVNDSPDTPIDVPLHPQAQKVWVEYGWIS